MTQRAVDDRLWSEWLSRYLAHCRGELSARELTLLATALDRGVGGDARLDRGVFLSERVATVARPLVDFIATAPTDATRIALAREAAVRLRAAARSSR